MSLRARLTLFFVVIVVLPVAVATAYGWQAVARSSQRQVQAELEQARRSAMVAFGTRADRAQQAMTVLANDPALLQAMAAGDAARVQAVLRGQRVTDLLLAVTAPDGRVLGRAGDTSPGFLPGIGRAPLAMLLPREPMVRSWPTLQRRSADLNGPGCWSASRPPRPRPGSARACWPSCCWAWWWCARWPPCSARCWPGWSAAPWASWPGPSSACGSSWAST